MSLRIAFFVSPAVPVLTLALAVPACIDASSNDGSASGGASAGRGDTAGSSGSGAAELSDPLATTPFSYLDCQATAPTPADPPPGGTSVTTGSLNTFGGGDDYTADFEDVAVEGQTLTTARRATITGTPPNPWNVQFQKSSTAPIATGDVLLADFWARCERTLEESDECRLEFIVEDSSTYTKAINYPVRVGRDWTHFYVALEAPQDYATGGAHLAFFAGYADQTVELGPFDVSNYGTGVDIDTLPSTAVTYPGIAADASWRTSASERIDQYRRGDLTVTVSDAAGQPVADATVEVKMTQHEFLFGSAISSGIVARGEEPAEYDRYEAEVTRLFNVVTAYNAFKWKPWAGDWGTAWDTQRAADTLTWAEDRGITYRGHVLVWPGWNHLPESLAALETDPTVLRQAVLDHIDEAMALTRGRVAQWDVVNEPYDNHDLMDILGDDVVVEWFERARAGDPDVKLYLNDYAILTGGAGETGHRDDFERWIQMLVDAGAPLDGLGLQSHFGLALTGPDEVLRLLDRYGSTFDKDVAVTEYDVNVDDENLAGCFTHDFMTAIFSHPKTTTFVMWGFWGDEDPLFATDWRQKPAGRVFEDLVLRRWWTDETTTSDATGSAAVRAFYGTYDVTVTARGESVTQTVTHSSAAPATVEIALP